MSRIGKIPVAIPKGVQVTIADQKVEVKGPKGVLSRNINKELEITIKDNAVHLKPRVQDEHSKALWGLNNVIIRNMIIGVTEGYRKELEVVGVGYKAEMKGKDLFVTVGFTSPVLYKTPDGIKISVENQVKIVIEGIDKEKVGQVAAEIRNIRPPEPYKGKGIKYVGEYLRRKAGKTATK